MSVTAKMRRAPLRVATGAYILNSGLAKLTADEDTSKQLHGMASGSLPPVQSISPRIFAKVVGAGEIALGGALILPIVPVGVAGLGLAAFSGALLTMYWRTPGMHQEGSIRPTQQGQGLAKDVWMAGIAGGLIVDAVTSPVHDKKVEVTAVVGEKVSRRQARKARREVKRQRKETITQAKISAKLAAAQAKDAATHAKDVAVHARVHAKEAAVHAKVSARDAAAQARIQAKDAANHTKVMAQTKAKDLADQTKVAAAKVHDRVA